MSLPGVPLSPSVFSAGFYHAFLHVQREEVLYLGILALCVLAAFNSLGTFFFWLKYNK